MQDAPTSNWLAGHPVLHYDSMNLNTDRFQIKDEIKAARIEATKAYRIVR